MIHKNEAFMMNTKKFKTTRERKHLITFFWIPKQEKISLDKIREHTQKCLANKEVPYRSRV